MTITSQTFAMDQISPNQISMAPPRTFFHIATAQIAVHERRYPSRHRPWIASLRMKYQGGLSPGESEGISNRSARSELSQRNSAYSTTPAHRIQGVGFHGARDLRGSSMVFLLSIAGQRFTCPASSALHSTGTC